MADLVLTDAFVSVGGTDISNNVRSVSVTYNREALVNTKMGMTSHSRVGGLFDWSVSFECITDEAASQVSATLFPLVGTTFTVIVRPVGATVVGPANPNYTGTAFLESHQIIGGEVGQLSMSPTELLGSGALSRATA